MPTVRVVHHPSAHAATPDNSYAGVPSVLWALHAQFERALAAMTTGATRNAIKFVRDICMDGESDLRLTDLMV